MVGIAASKAIEKSKAIIIIPYDLLITLEKVHSQAELVKIIKAHPTMFLTGEHAAENTILLFVIVEMLKGEKSNYFHYFEIGRD